MYRRRQRRQEAVLRKFFTADLQPDGREIHVNTKLQHGAPSMMVQSRRMDKYGLYPLAKGSSRRQDKMEPSLGSSPIR